MSCLLGLVAGSDFAGMWVFITKSGLANRQPAFCTLGSQLPAPFPSTSQLPARQQDVEGVVVLHPPQRPARFRWSQAETLRELWGLPAAAGSLTPTNRKPYPIQFFLDSLRNWLICTTVSPVCFAISSSERAVAKRLFAISISLSSTAVSNALFKSRY